MTREDLVRKKLGEIEAFVAELRSLGRPAEIESDLVQQRFVEHTLQLAIQAMLDVASHIVADDRLGEAEDNAGLFTILARHGWISDELSAILKRVVGFRYVLVHGYSDVDLSVVREVVEHRLDDLLLFVVAVRLQLQGSSSE